MKITPCLIAVLCLLAASGVQAQQVVLSGKVIQRPGGDPVEGAAVRLMMCADHGVKNAITDTDGYFHIIGRYSEEDFDCEIIIEHENFYPLNGMVKLNFGTQTFRQFYMFRQEDGVPAEKPSLEGLPANNLIFLVDISGSMGEHHRLEHLKESLLFLIDLYRPEDRISLITYSSSVEVLLNGASTSSGDAVQQAVSSLQPEGDTRGVYGVLKAFEVAKANYMQGGNNKVIMATDGVFGEDRRSRKNIVSAIESGVNAGVGMSIFSFGPVSNEIADRLNDWSSLGNGTHTHVTSLRRVKDQIVREAGAR